MATPNYGYEKRLRELAKKQKKEAQLRAKSQRKADGTHDDQPDAGDENGQPASQQPPGADGG